MSGIWLNIGCGKKHLSGFVNMDITQPFDKKLDVRKGLSYSDQTVDGVYSEQFFEHLTQAEGFSFLRECRRVLKPGGRVRIVTGMQPDDESTQPNQREQPFGQKWELDYKCLKKMAAMSGLKFHQQCIPGQSEVSEFCDLERHDDHLLALEFIKGYRLLENSAQPLVSILVPSYNPTYFRVCLESALAQTYSHLEIIVSDDCESSAIQDIVAEYLADHRLHYRKNTPRLGGIENFKHAFNQARGDFIKFLNDDDVLHPACVERMLDCYRRFPDITMVTSHRQLIDENDAPLPDKFGTHRLARQDALLDGNRLATLAILSRVNFLGEPTSVLFRRDDLADTNPDIMSFGGYPSIRVLCDLAMWLNLLGKGHVMYLNESLSSFRIHPEQRQRDPEVRKMAGASWDKLQDGGYRMGYLGMGGWLAVPAYTSTWGKWKADYLSFVNFGILPLAIVQLLKIKLKQIFS